MLLHHHVVVVVLALRLFRVELEHINDSLRVLRVVFLRDGRCRQQLGPLIWQTLAMAVMLVTYDRTIRPTTVPPSINYREHAAIWVETDMDFVYKVGGIGYTHQWRALIVFLR